MILRTKENTQNNVCPKYVLKSFLLTVTAIRTDSSYIIKSKYRICSMHQESKYSPAKSFMLNWAVSCCTCIGFRHSSEERQISIWVCPKMRCAISVILVANRPSMRACFWSYIMTTWQYSIDQNKVMIKEKTMYLGYVGHYHHIVQLKVNMVFDL